MMSWQLINVFNLTDHGIFTPATCITQTYIFVKTYDKGENEHCHGSILKYGDPDLQLTVIEFTFH